MALVMLCLERKKSSDHVQKFNEQDLSLMGVPFKVGLHKLIHIGSWFLVFDLLISLSNIWLPHWIFMDKIGDLRHHAQRQSVQIS